MKITHNSWVNEALHTNLTGDTPPGSASPTRRTPTLGKGILITNQYDWTQAEIVGAYRSQSYIEVSFRQLKDRHVHSF